MPGSGYQVCFICTKQVGQPKCGFIQYYIVRLCGFCGSREHKDVCASVFGLCNDLHEMLRFCLFSVQSTNDSYLDPIHTIIVRFASVSGHQTRDESSVDTSFVFCLYDGAVNN